MVWILELERVRKGWRGERGDGDDGGFFITPTPINKSDNSKIDNSFPNINAIHDI